VASWWCASRHVAFGDSIGIQRPSGKGYAPNFAQTEFSEVRQKLQRSLVWVMRLVPMFASVGALYDLRWGLFAPPLLRKEGKRSSRLGGMARTPVVRK
jgi:hypothetical protein